MSVSIVIVSYNAREHLETCLFARPVAASNGPRHHRRGQRFDG